MSSGGSTKFGPGPTKVAPAPTEFGARVGRCWGSVRPSLGSVRSARARLGLGSIRLGLETAASEAAAAEFGHETCWVRPLGRKDRCTGRVHRRYFATRPGGRPPRAPPFLAHGEVSTVARPGRAAAGPTQLSTTRTRSRARCRLEATRSGLSCARAEWPRGAGARRGPRKLLAPRCSAGAFLAAAPRQPQHGPGGWRCWRCGRRLARRRPATPGPTFVCVGLGSTDGPRRGGRPGAEAGVRASMCSGDAER